MRITVIILLILKYSFPIKYNNYIFSVENYLSGGFLKYNSPGLVKEIIQELKKLLAENESDFTLLYDYGNALMNDFRYDEAIPILEKALSLKDNNKIRLSLGFAYKSVRKFDKAVKHFKVCVEKNPQYADVHYHLAECLNDMGKADEAIEEYMKSLYINPDYVEALYSLGDLYRQMGMLEETLELYKRIIDNNIILKKDFTDITIVQYDLAYLYTEKALFDDAIKHLENIAARHPEYADVHFKLGKLFKKKGETKRAMEEFETAIRINPNYRDARDEYWDM